MQDSTTSSFVTAIVCLVLIAFASAPSTWQFVRRLSSNVKAQDHEYSDKYEDEDGVATEESDAAYSDLIPRLLILLISLVGLLDSLALAILATLRVHLPLATEQWLQFASWIALLFQAVVIFTTPQYTRKFALGGFGALSCIFLLIALLVEYFSFWSLEDVPEARNVHLSLIVIHFIAAFSLLIANISIPRRPDVYRNGKVVDRQYTVALLPKLAFSWATPLLSFTLGHRGLEIDDLPEIDHEQRSKNLRKKFEAVGKKDRLWKSVFWSHKQAFILQWILITVTSITNFLPQVALLFILRTLEVRDAGGDAAVQAWIWVIALGASMTIASWFESWLFFVVLSKIGIPVYEQLSAVVFRKALLKKDVKSASKKKDDAAQTDEELLLNKGSGVMGEDTAVEINNDKDDDDDGDEVQKSRQSTINLVGVDSKRISNFATFNYLFPGTIIKLTLAFAFLVTLIGWIPLLAGLAVFALLTPVNVFAAKRYSASQDDLMKVRDQKMAVVTEALQGIRQIKFSALEHEWHTRILDMRKRELKTQWKVFVFNTVLISIWITAPVILGAVALAVYAIINKQLTASIAFTTVAIFEAIDMTLSVIPEFITEYLDAKVSAERIEKYLNSAEREDKSKPGPTVAFQNATIAWPSEDTEKEEDQFQIRDITLAFPKKELSVIAGKTGSGKSLLLATIVGEAEVLKGTLEIPTTLSQEERHDSGATRSDWYIPGCMALVSQIPWIENATIKDNILFGLPHDSTRYKKVLHACALEKDLEMLEDKDMTDIGANGINLSGGQKWRLSFARALYSRAEILILDDIFSAVDSHVGRTLFEEALTGELGRGRTRILVTHHVALCLPKTKYVVLLGDGRVERSGTVEELRQSGDLKAVLANDIEVQQEEEEAELQSALTIDDGGGLQKILTNRSGARRRSTMGDGDSPRPRRRSTNVNLDPDAKQTPVPKKFTEEEGREQGRVKTKIYTEYVRASGGWPYWLFLVVAFALANAMYLGRSWWVSVWTRSYNVEATLSAHRWTTQTIIKSMNSELQAVNVDPDLWFYLGIYIAWSVASSFFGASRYLWVFYGAIRASRDLFEKLTYAVLRAPLRWLDTVPVGRVLNRFTSDFNMVDSSVPMDFAFMLHNVMQLITVIVAGLLVSPWMIVFAFLLLACSMYYALRYLAGAREVKRLESNAKSPIFEQFGSTLMGIGTIRAFNKTDSYLDKMYTNIDRHARASWHLWLFNRWMSFRLNMVGAVFASVTAALIVSTRAVDASLAGFALSFALEISVSVTWMIRQYANVELDANALERIVEYSNIVIEDQGGDSAPAAWPTEGRLEVSNLVVAYSPDLDPVLKGLSFSVRRNQRVGVVGRTGAGKSSLTLALFRFLEAREGAVLIDGIDISKIKLHDLRSRLAIIPQDPVLFSGTVRTNLDAFDDHTDAELRDALERVKLIGSSTQTPAESSSGSATPVEPNLRNTNVFTSLQSKISEGGLNLSQGQRQLLCLARAIVSRPKIMVLDEATSAVDMETDALIQRSIREEFQDSTLIVIAHRLSTIADFDKILVMGDGRVLEYDAPKQLMEKEGGEFRQMVEQSGEREVLEGIIDAGEQRPAQ